MGAAKKMRPPCSLGRGKENTLIYDSADIELLRFAAAAKNIPPDLQYRLSSRVWDREHIHTLCAQKLLAENRNHLSISLTLKGATLLNHLGWPVTLDAKQPARNKLERRLQSAWTAALFYRAGFGIFNNKASDLAMPETYLPVSYTHLAYHDRGVGGVGRDTGATDIPCRNALCFYEPYCKAL